MFHPDALHHYVLELFQKAFGPPHTTLGRDFHWGLQSSSDARLINVLVNGTQESASIWIFDAHDHDECVTTASITRKEDVDEVISRIQKRVRRDARPATPRKA